MNTRLPIQPNAVTRALASALADFARLRHVHIQFVVSKQRFHALRALVSLLADVAPLRLQGLVRFRHLLTPVLQKVDGL